MKAGIVTLFDKSNIGNRLQNYAVSHILEQTGIRCETLVPPASKRSEAQIGSEAEQAYVFLSREANRYGIPFSEARAVGSTTAF